MMHQSVLLVFLFGKLTNGAFPTGCSYDHAYSSTGIYTCAYGSYSSPLNYASFSSPYPQRLQITDLKGAFPSSGSAFSGFTSFSSNNFDRNYPATLELVCSSSITLSTGTFTDMGYLQEVKFSYCAITTLTSGILGSFGSLNSLIFEFGSVGSYTSDFLTGVSIQPLSVPESKGELVFKDFKLTPTALPAGVFDTQSLAKIIRIKNAGITAIDKTVFSLTTQLNHISITDNPLTTLDNSLFNTLNSLSTVDFVGIAYDCTCATLGVLTYAMSHSVTLSSDLICNTPTAYQNKKSSKYYKDICSAKSTCSGIFCTVSVYEILGFSFLFAALVISCIALGIICHSRRQLMTAYSVAEQRKSKSWTKVQNAFNGGRGRQPKPPMGKGNSDGWM